MVARTYPFLVLCARGRPKGKEKNCLADSSEIFGCKETLLYYMVQTQNRVKLQLKSNTAQGLRESKNQ
jgi:hypothetical protein